MVDTGACHSTISPQLVDQLSLPHRASALLHGVTGSAEVGVSHIDTLEVGQLRLQDQELPIVTTEVTEGIDGILGVAGFHDECVARRARDILRENGYKSFMNAGTDNKAATEPRQPADARAARDHFARELAAGKANSTTLLGLAYACSLLKDEAGMTAVLDRLLQIEPRNVRALILKADHLASVNDTRSAASFYQAALRNAPPPHEWPADLAPELRRVQQACVNYAEQYRAYLRERLAAQGFNEQTSSERFVQSFDIVLGQRQVFVSQPRYYYYPGLPQIQFQRRETLAFLDAIERATDDIRTELLGVLENPASFAPYVQGDPRRAPKEQAGMLNNPAWSAFYLWKNGEIVPENAARCPKTLAALAAAPLARVPNRSPSILFSLLGPGAHIPPHTGLVNTRLICHLPLVVPGRCRFRVGNESRYCEQGRAWAFDDTVEHEAWNLTDRRRVILLFDIWRPELTEEERALVVALFEAIDAFDGRKPEWEI